MRIALLHNTKSRYGVLRRFGVELMAAMEDLAETAIFDTSNEEPPSFFQRWKEFDAELLISFNGLFVSPDGLLTADLLQVPTQYWLVDAPYHFDLVESPWARYACVDRAHCDYLKQRIPGSDPLFLPHAVVSPTNATGLDGRVYGCAMLSSAIDCAKLVRQWRERFSKDVVEKMLYVSDEFLKGGYQGLWQPFAEVFDTQDNAEDVILQQIDYYVKGKGRLELLRAAAPHTVHLWGGGDDWLAILKDDFSHVIYHGVLPNEKVKEVLSQCRVLFNSCNVITDGAHERILEGLCDGCAVFCEKTPYLMERFGTDSGLVYSSQPELLGLILDNEEERQKAVLRGQKAIAAGELWRHRAEVIVNSMEKQ